MQNLNIITRLFANRAFPLACNSTDICQRR